MARSLLLLLGRQSDAPHSALQQPSPVSCPSVFVAFRCLLETHLQFPVFLSAVSGVLLNSLTGFNFQSYDFQFF